MVKNLSTGSKIWIGIGILILIIVLWFVGAYNGLIRASAEVDESFANIETQYQRRADLIPNLVESVQGAVKFEKETQTEIAALRTRAVAAREALKNAKTQQETLAAMNQIDSAASTFSGLNINVENYPQLKATENFLNLQAQLEGTENRVAVARNRYNDKVKVFNVKIRKIPTVIIANMFGYEKQPFFESQPGTENVPKVDFG